MENKQREMERCQEELIQSMRVKEKKEALSDIRNMISNHRDLMELSKSDPRMTSALPTGHRKA
jgi:hypothetical protein